MLHYLQIYKINYIQLFAASSKLATKTLEKVLANTGNIKMTSK